jgi:hypothetical protein
VSDLEVMRWVTVGAPSPPTWTSSSNHRSRIRTRLYGLHDCAFRLPDRANCNCPYGWSIGLPVPIAEWHRDRETVEDEITDGPEDEPAG